MKKVLLLAALFVVGCTYYTEKQSEALSQNVYAANDSLNKARVDLAYYYRPYPLFYIILLNSVKGNVRPNAIAKSSPRPIAVTFFSSSVLILVGVCRG